MYVLVPIGVSIWSWILLTETAFMIAILGPPQGRLINIIEDHVETPCRH